MPIVCGGPLLIYSHVSSFKNPFGMWSEIKDPIFSVTCVDKDVFPPLWIVLSSVYTGVEGFLHI